MKLTKISWGPDEQEPGNVISFYYTDDYDTETMSEPGTKTTARNLAQEYGFYERTDTPDGVSTWRKDKL